MPKVKKTKKVVNSEKKPVKPRGKLGPFSWYTKLTWAEFKKNHPGVKIPLIANMKLLTESWKNLSEELKKPFHDLAAADKQRYNDEMKRYNPSFKPVKIRRSRMMRKKDPNYPRTPLNCYLWFCDEEGPKLRERAPGMTYAEFNTELGKLWKEIDPERREIYEKLSARDFARYAKEMKEYQQRMEMAAEAEGKPSSTVSAVENESSSLPESPSGSSSTSTSTSVGLTGGVVNVFEDSRESGFEDSE